LRDLLVEKYPIWEDIDTKLRDLLIEKCPIRITIRITDIDFSKDKYSRHFRIDYFLYIVDKAITTLQNSFEQFKIYKDIFGFLFSSKKLKSFSWVLLKEKCLNL